MTDNSWGLREQSRRIGRRTPADGVATLLVPGRRRRTLKRVPVQISNVSVSGLGFLTDHSVLLRVGSLVTFELQGESSVVRIRRSGDVDHGRLTYYGVEFTESDPAVLPLIERQLSLRQSVPD